MQYAAGRGYAHLDAWPLKRYAHALASGYVLLAANTVFTLASVPLAFGI